MMFFIVFVPDNTPSWDSNVICVVFLSSVTDLYECSMAWLGYSFVFILSHSEVVTELPHSQVRQCYHFLLVSN